MTLSERKSLIETLLKEHLHTEQLTVIDESHFHKGHAGAATGASHFAVEIQAACLNNLTRIQQHQKIYSIIGYLIPTEIHALRIIII